MRIPTSAILRADGLPKTGTMSAGLRTYPHSRPVRRLYKGHAGVTSLVPSPPISLAAAPAILPFNEHPCPPTDLRCWPDSERDPPIAQRVA